MWLKTSRWTPFAEQELFSQRTWLVFLFLLQLLYHWVHACIKSSVCLYRCLTIETIIHLITYINIIATFPVPTCLITHAIIYLVHVYKVISLFVHTCLTISAIEPFDTCTHIAVHLVNTGSFILTGRLFTIIYILNKIIQLYI